MFKIHLRVVVSLMIREMSTRYGSRPGGYLWALFDPLVYIAMLTFFRTAFSAVPPIGNSLALFIASGYLGFQFYRGTSSYVSSSVQANKALLNYPRVAPIDSVFARLFLQFLTTTAISATTLAVILCFSGEDLAFDWLTLSEAAFAATAFALGVALCNVALFARFPIYEQVFGLINRPLLMLSGVFILPDELPHPFVDYLLFNPVVHIVIWFRKGIYPEYRGEFLDQSFVMECSITLLFLGMALFSVHRTAIKDTG